MNSTMTVTGALAELDRVRAAKQGGNIAAYQTLAEAVRAELARPSDADELTAQAEAAARTMAPPVPDVTVNGSYTVRAVMPGHPAEPGLLASWRVACQETVSGSQWVTWEAYKLNGIRAGFLAYDAGHYFHGPDGAANKRDALADLAVRAGTIPEMARRIADEIVRYHPEHGPYTASQREDRRMANRLRKWA